MTAYKPQLPTPTAKWVQSDEPKSGGLTHIADIPVGASPANRVPVIVLLHGWNGNERQMWSHRSAFPRGVAVVSPRGPVAGDGGNSQFGWFTSNAGTARQKLAAFIRALPDIYPVDGNRVILVGFSQGAVMANDYALTPNTRLAGVASLSGKLGVQKSGSATAVPVLITHGHSDPEIEPKNADLTKDAYDKAGAAVEVYRFAGGHYLDKNGRNKLGQWLRSVIKEAKAMNEELLLEAELSVLEAEIALAEMKANPYHDPKDGKFSTRAGGAAYGWLSPAQRAQRLPKAKREAAGAGQGQPPNKSPKPADGGKTNRKLVEDVVSELLPGLAKGIPAFGKNPQISSWGDGKYMEMSIPSNKSLDGLGGTSKRKKIISSAQKSVMDAARSKSLFPRVNHSDDSSYSSLRRLELVDLNSPNRTTMLYVDLTVSGKKISALFTRPDQ